MDKVIHKELSYQIVGILFDVYNELGYGYQEKYYERAVEQYFIRKKLKYKNQPSYKLIVKDKEIGRYFLDFLVEDKVIVELKVVPELIYIHHAQVINYLKAFSKEVGLLINFGESKLKFKRFVK